MEFLIYTVIVEWQCSGTMCSAHPFVVEWHLPHLFSLFLFLSISFPSQNSLITNFFVLSIVLFQIDTNLKENYLFILNLIPDPYFTVICFLSVSPWKLLLTTSHTFLTIWQYLFISASKCSSLCFFKISKISKISKIFLKS